MPAPYCFRETPARKSEWTYAGSKKKRKKSKKSKKKSKKSKKK